MAATSPESRLHVAYVVHGFPERSETFVANEVARVRAAGVRVTLHVTRDPIVAAPDLADLAGVAPQRLPPDGDVSWPGVARLLLALARSRPLGVLLALALVLRDPRWPNRRAFRTAVSHAHGLRDAGVDLIHAHFADHPTSVAMYSAALLGVPFTFTGHAYDLFREPFDLRRKMRRAATVVDVCDYNRRLVEEAEGSIGHHVLVPCGVDTHAFRRTSPPPSDEFSIVAVGRLVPKKGFVDLLDALRLLVEDGRRVTCTVIGHGPLHDDLTTRADELGLGDTVRFVGVQPPSVVRATLESAAVFCLPCVVADDGDRDSQPVVIKEAMALELPVVSTTEVGVPEMVDDQATGLLVAPRDPVALAAALAALQDDEARRRAMGERA